MTRWGPTQGARLLESQEQREARRSVESCQIASPLDAELRGGHLQKQAFEACQRFIDSHGRHHVPTPSRSASRMPPPNADIRWRDVPVASRTFTNPRVFGDPAPASDRPRDTSKAIELACGLRWPPATARTVVRC